MIQQFDYRSSAREDPVLKRWNRICTEMIWFITVGKMPEYNAILDQYHNNSNGPAQE